MSKDFAISIEAQELARFARERSSFYAFLNMHFMMLPDENFIQQMRHPDLVEAFAALAMDPGIDPELTKGWARFRSFLEETGNTPIGALAQTLGVDRTRLYRGVSASYGPPPPYEAVWLNEGREVEKELGRLTATYREAGLEPGKEFNERADYIGIEMDYLRQMTLQEAEAWESGDIPAVMEIIRKEKLFAKSMREWVSRFTAEAMKFAQTDLYRGHLQMVNGFLADEVERLEAPIEEIQCITG